ncbi:MAG: metal ABC transporter permease [Gemmatimonadetes bacterium]|nr:metal ABC transporter permease [Gemmatimonadota bacterium]
MSAFLEIMIRPFVACMILVALHSYLGLHVIAREVIFVDLSLAQMAALGTTTGLLFGVTSSSLTAQLFSVGAVVIGAAIFAATRTKNHGRVPQEAIIGIVFVLASAAALLIANRVPSGGEAIREILEGTVLWVTWPTILKLAAAYVVLGAYFLIMRSRFETISFEPRLAETKGWRIRWWDFWFYLGFGIVITFSVPIAGVPLVFSFLVVPAVVAFLFTRRPGILMAVSWATGVIASTAGLAASYLTDWPTAPLIVCTFGLVLLLCALGRRVFAREAVKT